MSRRAPIFVICILLYSLSLHGQQMGVCNQQAPSSGTSPDTTYICVGQIVLKVQRLSRSSHSDAFIPLNQQISANLSIALGSAHVFALKSPNTTLQELARSINTSTASLGLHAQVLSGKAPNTNTLQITSNTQNTSQPLQIDGSLSEAPPSQSEQPPTATPSFPFTSGTPDYKLSLDSNQSAAPPILIRTSSGAIADLRTTSYVLAGSAKPMVTLILGSEGSSLCRSFSMNDLTKCHVEYLLARRLLQQDVVIAVADTREAVSVRNDILSDSQQFMLVNGERLSLNLAPYSYDPDTDVVVSLYRVVEGCKLYAGDTADWVTISLPRPPPPAAGPQLANGIVVGASKIFDAFALKNMLNATATQLASISGFSSTPIVAALGTLQGVTRDTSFLALQATTTPLPTISSTASQGLTNNTSGSTTLPVQGSPGIVTVQCPDGSLPSIGTGGVQACTASPGTTGSSSSVTTVPAGSTQQGTSSQATQQSSQTMSSGGFAGTVPTAPTSTALAAPTNISVSSSDILAEQVELNSQITTLRLLLQGANSDQYLTSNGKAVAVRQQTTLGFTVSLDPPRQYKHAVAEVRIIVVPPQGRGSVSIMNLLPTDKTYNVAKVTSKQNSFGAGVALEPVSVGGNVGRSKDRLYLAKDTDTLALLFQSQDVPPVDRPIWQSLHDQIRGTVSDNPLDPCDPLVASTDGATIFGWQFRPVLGEEYVRGGQRQVFAQLALPASLQSRYEPTVYVQTRWRDYNPQKQVVGAVFKDSCSVSTDQGGLAFLNPLRIRSLKVSDIGNSQVRLTATGDFYSSSMSVRSGPTNVLPTTFDGTNIEVFGSLHDILQIGDLSIVAQDGTKQPFSILTDPTKINQCGISDVTANVLPQPDGNSLVHATLTLGPAFNLSDSNDGPPQPYFLIGSTLFGVQETPYLQASCKPSQSPGSAAQCDYVFIAPTQLIRNSQDFLVEDIAWDSFKKRGTFSISPAFSALAVSSISPVDPTGVKKDPADVTVFSLSGFDFNNLDFACNDSTKSCSHVFVGTTVINAPDISSRNVATLTLTSKTFSNAKALRITVQGKKSDAEEKSIVEEWDLAFPKADASAKPSATPAFFYQGDSQTLTVSGGDVDFSTVKDVKFDGKVYYTPSTKPASSKLEFLVTTDVTKSEGHKEFTIDLLDSQGKAKTATVAIDVARR